jgi:Putative transposase
MCAPQRRITDKSLALARLTESARGGQVVFALPHPRADGATHLLLDPLELIEKLTLLIPPPRFHTLRFHGVLAPHAVWRSAVIPGRPEAEAEGFPAAVGSPRESASRWAALLRRVFALDVLACPRCSCRRRLVGVPTGGEPL